jgi:hypothetical protein
MTWTGRAARCERVSESREGVRYEIPLPALPALWPASIPMSRIRSTDSVSASAHQLAPSPPTRI